MQVSFEKDAGIITAKIAGELDHHTAGHLRDKIDKEIAKNGVKELILDLANLTFMDSSGIGVIIGRYKNIKALGGKLFIKNPNLQIDKLLSISGIKKIVPIITGEKAGGGLKQYEYK